MISSSILPAGHVNTDPQLQDGLDAVNAAPAGASSASQVSRIGDDDLVLSPGLDRTSRSVITPLPEAAAIDPVQTLLQSSIPGVPVAPQILTPAVDPGVALCNPSMDAVVGACVAPVAPTLPPPLSLSAKNGPSLRLPSFEALGIANPHSSSGVADNPPLLAQPSDPLAVLRGPERLLHQGTSLGGQTSGPISRTLSLDIDTRLPPPIRLAAHAIETLTPPDEDFQSSWDNLAPSANRTAPEHPLSVTSEPTRPGPTPIVSGQARNGNGTDAPGAPRIEIQRTVSDNARSAWVDEASDTIVANLNTSQGLSSAVKVLSHALPCPSPTGFVFPRVISAIQLSSVGTPLCWINVFHALPSKFGLNEVPTSPPTTPDPPVGGRDYFTSMTFDSAVRVSDYEEDLSSMPRSPHPIVPPGTIGVSIIERYIPPTSSNEFAEMFRLGGRSLLIDRLVELVEGGSLLFIYPTKTGADTFMREYLGPILDPLLRSIRTLHHLPVELITSLGGMSAVASMLDFDELLAKLQRLCQDLSGSGSHLGPRLAMRSNLVIDLAQRQTVMLERSVWAERWWTKQEKARIRENVTRYFGSGRPGVAQSDITPTSLVHTVLDGVAQRPFPRGTGPINGVEVAVFVIRRLPADT